MIAVGAISSYDDVNSILLAGRADLCALGRTHLYNPQWTLHAAAEQEYAAPAPSGRCRGRPGGVGRRRRARTRSRRGCRCCATRATARCTCAGARLLRSSVSPSVERTYRASLLHCEVAEVDGEGVDVEGVVVDGVEVPDGAGRQPGTVITSQAGAQRWGLDPPRLVTGRGLRREPCDGEGSGIGLTIVGGASDEGDPGAVDAANRFGHRDQMPGPGLGRIPSDSGVQNADRYERPPTNRALGTTEPQSKSNPQSLAVDQAQVLAMVSAAVRVRVSSRQVRRSAETKIFRARLRPWLPALSTPATTAR